MEKNKNTQVAFAVLCQFNELIDDDEYIPLTFFVTFNTKNEDEAINLAKCFCGTTRNAKDSIVVLDREGKIW